MQVLVEMPPEHYDAFVAQCGAERPEYAVLKNGVIVNRQAGGAVQRMIEILCDEAVARTLLATAESLHLPAAEDIRRALDPLRDL